MRDFHLILSLSLALLTTSNNVLFAIGNEAAESSAIKVDPVGALLRKIKSGEKRTDLVIYNRVPKTGSSSLQQVVESLGLSLGYEARHFIQPPGIKCGR